MALVKNLAEILKGPVEIKKDGTAIAHTDDSTKVTIIRGIAPERPDELPADSNFYVGVQGIVIEGNLLQWSIDILEFLIPELTREGDVLYGGLIPGKEIAQANVFACVLHPLRQGASVAHDVKIYKAACVGDPVEMETAATKTRKMPFKMVAIPDTSKADGKQLFSIGETADAAAPTRSSSYPVDAAPDIAIDVVPHVVFSKGMSRSAMADGGLNPRGIYLYDITTGAVVPVLVSFAKSVLDDDKVLITPVASLQNSAEHAVLVDTSAYSKGGGQHAGSESTFTTVV